MITYVSHLLCICITRMYCICSAHVLLFSKYYICTTFMLHMYSCTLRAWFRNLCGLQQAICFIIPVTKKYYLPRNKEKDDIKIHGHIDILQ